MILGSVGLWAQGGGTVPGGSQVPAPAGNAEVPPVLYASGSIRPNVLLLSMNTETTYDDNVFSTNRLRRGDLLFHLSPRIALREERKRLSLAFDYLPDLLLYREAKGYDAFNHGVQLDTNFRFSPHFSLRVTDSFSYRIGLYQPPPSEEITPAPGPSTTPNPTVFTPLARQRDNNVRVDVVYQKSARTSLDWFGGFHRQDFSQVATAGSSLQDNQGMNAGLEYRYRLDRHNTLGAVYLFQNLSFQQGQRTVVHTAMLSFDRQLSPSVTVSVFGGPAYVSLHDQLTLDLLFFTITVPVASTQTGWTLGANFTKRAKNSVFQVSANHQVSQGGGLLGAVSSSFVSLNMNRRLVGHWSATWSFAYADNSALSAAQRGSHVRSAIASFGVEHQLTGNLTTRLGYTHTRQTSGAPTLLFSGLNENRVSLGVFYRYHQIPLGR